MVCVLLGVCFILLAASRESFRKSILEQLQRTRTPREKCHPQNETSGPLSATAAGSAVVVASIGVCTGGEWDERYSNRFENQTVGPEFRFHRKENGWFGCQWDEEIGFQKVVGKDNKYVEPTLFPELGGTATNQDVDYRLDLDQVE